MSTTSSQTQAKEKHVYTGSTLLQVLEQVLKNIKLERPQIKKQNEELKKMVEQKVIKGGLMKDPLFKKLFQEILWTGSFYEGLKISAPDEFDLNIIMRTPCLKTVQLEVTCTNAPPGYVCVNNLGNILNQLKETKHPYWPIYEPMLKWCDAKGALLQSKFRSWLEGLLTKFVNANKEELNTQLGLSDIKMTKSGPAMTLETKSERTPMSIDLVLALEFKTPVDPPHPFKKLTPSGFPWYVVPKPTSDGKYDSAWRVSCCKQERKMIESHANLKPAIRLIKKLRDTQNWKRLHSYHIKTAVYWEIKENTVNWNQKIDGVFMQLLKLLQIRIKNDKVKLFWDPRQNMLSHMNVKKPNSNGTERENIANHLERIIRKFEENMVSNPAFIGDTIAPYKN